MSDYQVGYIYKETLERKHKAALKALKKLERYSPSPFYQYEVKHARKRLKKAMNELYLIKLITYKDYKAKEGDGLNGKDSISKSEKNA